MAEQRTNASGEKVEYNEATGRWDKVVGKAKVADSRETVAMGSDAPGVEAREAGTGDPAPAEDETVVSEGASTPRKAKK
jgi:hypothetical protein